MRSTVHINNLNKNLSINHVVRLSSLSVTTYLDFFFVFPANHNWNPQKKRIEEKKWNGNEIPVILVFIFIYFYLFFFQIQFGELALPPSWHVCPLPGSQQFLTGNWKPSISYISCCSCCVCIIGKRRPQQSWKMFLITIWVCYLVLLYFRIGLDQLFRDILWENGLVQLLSILISPIWIRNSIEKMPRHGRTNERTNEEFKANYFRLTEGQPFRISRF
jgi:hypothetical protein